MKFKRQQGTIDDATVLKAVAKEAAARMKRKTDAPKMGVEILHGKVVARIEDMEFGKDALAAVLEAHEPECEGLDVTVLSITGDGVVIETKERTDETVDEPEEEAAQDELDLDGEDADDGDEEEDEEEAK